MADLLYLVDKPEGWTSHDAVARMRSLLGETRAGHAGTLDPFASGLLLVAARRATGALGTLSLLPKRYRARARLGQATDTQDRTGVVIRTSERIPAREAIERALARFRGAIRQTPPLYSAVKVRGERSYRAARRGVALEREARPAQVYELSLLGCEGPEIEIDLTVSRGTYVRTLAHDLGEALGCFAHLAALRRISIGPFSVEGALSCARGAGTTGADFRERARPLSEALAFLPAIALASDEAARLRHGRAPVFDPERPRPQRAAWPLPPGLSGWPLLLSDVDGTALALGLPACEQTPGLPLRLTRVLVGS